MPGDSPFELVADALEELSIPFIIINPRKFEEVDLIIHYHNGIMKGEISINADSYDLSTFLGIYNRAVDFSQIPEAQSLSPGDFQRHSLTFKLLNNWIETSNMRVLNKASAMSSNSSKPYQLSIIQPFFEVPDTLITNSLAEVHRFQKPATGLIYKSASGVRSIVKSFNEQQASNVNNIQYCPTLFQERLEGVNYRVHVVGQEIFAIKALSDSVDYRYSSNDGNKTDLVPIELNEKIREKCIALSQALHLPLAGIDLFECNDGRWFCFEVNPSPGFSYFETQTGQPISRAIAQYLSEGNAFQ